MAKQMWARMAAVGVLGLALTGGARADLRPDAVQAQGGVGKEGANVAALGVTWDWEWGKSRSSRFSGQTELVLSNWHANAAGGGSQDVMQVALVPVLRMTLDRGHSPWFVEAGIGASYLNKDYVTPEKTFSTRWNFYDLLGLGFRFGSTYRNEVGLRYVHVSNGSVRYPNPGEDLLLLRYARLF
jgi:hypothetical protein